jgi:hypothetical protein
VKGGFPPKNNKIKGGKGGFPPQIINNKSFPLTIINKKKVRGVRGVSPLN